MEDYRPPAPPPERRDRTLIGVLLTGCGCLTVIGILLVIGAGKFFSTIRGPVRIVRSQLEAINIGRYQLAYSYFSSQYQKEHSLNDFRNDVKEYPNLFSIRKMDLNQTSIVNDRSIVAGTIVGKDGSIIPVRYDLVKEKGQWRIQSYQWTPPGNLERV
jgi:hypothetical protein